MAEVAVSTESAQAYIRNLMVDADEEDDVRLHLTALCGDCVGLRWILTEPSSKQWLDYRVRPYMSPPIRLAVSGGNSQCVEALLEAGADIELEDVKGQTPLFVATSQRRTDIMKILLEAGANPDGSRKNRCCPLLVAVRDGYSEGVKLLLQFGADSEPFDQISTCVPGWPLHHAVVYAHFSCFMELIKGGAITNLTSLPYLVNPKIVARLSIPHAILKYAKEYPEFVKLYHESGGNLQQRNTTGATCWDEFLESSPAKNLLITLSGSPLSLKSLCRVSLRQLLGQKELGKLQSLEIPSCLFPFLNFEEFSHYSLRSEENYHIKLPDKE